MLMIMNTHIRNYLHNKRYNRTEKVIDMNYVRIGIAGPVGSGKTALVEKLAQHLAAKYSMVVVTNDIYTKEDAEYLVRSGVLSTERIVG